MKKLLLILLALLLVSCSVDEPEKPCECTIRGTLLISFDFVEWQYHGLDPRSGRVKFPCHMDGQDTNTIQRDGVWYKTHWTCLD